MSRTQPGTLFLVGTPIGNLADITLRATRTLREVDCVAAEDTRRTRALLSHLEISGKTLVKLNAHASDQSLAKVVARLEAGQSVALVTDAGMPAVSDPGTNLVHTVQSRGLRVEVIPGPSAVTAAVALSGLVEGPWLFVGFLPRRGRKRAAMLGRLAETTEPVVIFEAPPRAAATLGDLAQLMPERPAAVCRELTKLHEEVVRGPLAELAARTSWRGELVMVLGPAPGPQRAPQPGPELDERIAALLEGGATPRTVVTDLAPEAGLSRRELYARVQAIRQKHPTPRD